MIPDRISATFENSTILITGGTGFLGKILIEKLLRCCNVKKIFLLVRSKKGKTPKERLQDITDNMLFDLLRSQDPAAFKKCFIISGDITQYGLGLSNEDRKLLEDEVNFIIHSAASTRFDDTVKTALKFNTSSTNELLNLAENCKNLKVFVYVSTAYAFPKEKVLYEKPYKAPYEPQKVLDLLKFAKDDVIEKLGAECPNTYTLSKSLAEGVVVERMEKIPAMIVRPSIVCPILKEPLKGWCNNLQGPMGLFVGAGKGIIRSMYMKADSYADFIPADLTINGIMTGIWNYLENPKDQIINITSSSEYNYSWHELIETGKRVVHQDIPFNGCVWYPGGSIKSSRLIHNICFFLFQIIPALFLDFFLILLGYGAVLLPIQNRIQKGAEVFEYYTNRQWNFSNFKLTEIRARLNEREREIYKIDGEGINLRNYLKDCILCVRRNNLKETDDTLPRARIHMKIMFVVDRLAKLLILSAVFYYIYQYLKPYLQH